MMEQRPRQHKGREKVGKYEEKVTRIELRIFIFFNFIQVYRFME